MTREGMIEHIRKKGEEKKMNEFGIHAVFASLRWPELSKRVRLSDVLHVLDGKDLEYTPDTGPWNKWFDDIDIQNTKLIQAIYNLL